MTTMTSGERDLRLALLNSFLFTPHRRLKLIAALHQEAIDADPLFYARLAVWYAANGTVRDHKEVFAGMLMTGRGRELRQIGAALMAQLPPFQVARVVDFMKEVRHKMPRSARSAVERYLRERESDPQRFDRAAIQARKAMRHLYATLHIKPSPRADAILFKDEPPEESLAYQVKLLARTTSPAEQARLIVQARIPYTVAVGAIGTMAEPVIAALIEVMTPQELINTIGSLQEREALENPELKDRLRQKLAAAVADDRVSAYKARVAASAAGLDPEMVARLESVTDQKVRQSGRITRATALLVDKSSSMQEAISVGKQLAGLIAGVADAPLTVVAFDSMPYFIESEGPALSDWDRAFASIRAIGNTSIGAPLQALRSRKIVVEQIVIVTDEEENTAPYFVRTYKAYAEDFGVAPAVVIVRIGGRGGYLERQLIAEKIQVETLDFTGDYYALPNVVMLLARPSRLDLLLEIMATPLPIRKDRSSAV